MAGDARVGDRQAAILRIKLKYPNVETFIEKYAVNISRGGIFIASRTPKPVGTNVRFEFMLQAGETGISIIRGEGQVQWVREFDPNAPQRPHGMGLRFTQLDPESQKLIDRALAWQKEHIAPIRRELSGVGKLPERDKSAPHTLPTPQHVHRATETSAPHVLPSAADTGVQHVSPPIEDSAPHVLPTAEITAPHALPQTETSAPHALPAEAAAPLDPAPQAGEPPSQQPPPSDTLAKVALRKVAVARGTGSGVVVSNARPAPNVDESNGSGDAVIAALCEGAGLTNDDLDEAMRRLRARNVSADTDLASLFR